MKPYEPSIQNNNNNNNNNYNNYNYYYYYYYYYYNKFKKKIKKKIKIKVKRRGREESVRERERFLFFIFSSLCFFLRFIEIGPWDFVGARGKVGLCDESYAWVPKSWSFVKLHEIGNFLTCVIFSLKVI